MIDNYEIKKINNTNVLYLYINIDLEFGKHISKNKKNSINKTIKKYIKKNKIDFKEGIIALVVGSTLLGTIYLNKDNKQNNPNNFVSDSIITSIEKNINIKTDNIIEEIIPKDNEIAIKDNNIKQKEIINNSTKTTNTKEINNKNNNTTNNTNTPNNNTSSNNIDNASHTNNNEIDNNIKTEETINEVIDNNTYINIKRKDSSIIKLELEDYITSVVGAEMPASFNIEALKAQAIISRTYALKAISEGRILKDNESNQSYKTKEELKQIWQNNYNTYYNKIKDATNSTKGMYLTYNNKYIEAVFHSTSNGRTESSVNVWGNYYPYLISVSSEYDNTNPSYIKEKFLSYNELSNLLNIEINNETEINIISKTSSNRIEYLKINDNTYKGTDFRNKLGLRSTDFDINKNDEGITFITKGYGHGVGLSQYGANGMAKNGYNYKQILSHYYPNTSISS